MDHMHDIGSKCPICRGEVSGADNVETLHASAAALTAALIKARRAIVYAREFVPKTRQTVAVMDETLTTIDELIK